MGVKYNSGSEREETFQENAGLADDFVPEKAPSPSAAITDLIDDKRAFQDTINADDGELVREFPSESVVEAKADSEVDLPEQPDVYYEDLDAYVRLQGELAAEAELERADALKKKKAKARKNQEKAIAEYRRRQEEITEAENKRHLEVNSDQVYQQESLPLRGSGFDVYPSSNPEMQGVGQNPQSVPSSTDVHHSFADIDPGNGVASSGKDVESSAPVPIVQVFSAHEQGSPASENGVRETVYSRDVISPSGYPHGVYTEERDRADQKRKAYYDEEHQYRQEQQRIKNQEIVRELQQAGVEREKKSENYKSFGNEGIDFSGKNQHSAFVQDGGAAENASTISDGTYKSLRLNFERSRAVFQSFGNHVPEHVVRQYQTDSDRFFSVQRRIDSGAVTVVSTPPEPPRSTLLEKNSHKPIGGVEKTTVGSYGRDIERQPSGVAEHPERFAHSGRISHDAPLLFAQERIDSRELAGVSAPDPFVNLPFGKRVHESVGELERSVTGALGRDFDRTPSSMVERPEHLFLTHAGQESFYQNSVPTITPTQYAQMQERYEASKREVARYQGTRVPPEVLKRAEHIERRYQTTQDKIERGDLLVTSPERGATGVAPAAAGRFVQAGSSEVVYKERSGDFPHDRGSSQREAMPSQRREVPAAVQSHTEAIARNRTPAQREPEHRGSRVAHSEVLKTAGWAPIASGTASHPEAGVRAANIVAGVAGVSGAAQGATLTITRDRLSNLERRHLAMQREVASYQGTDVPLVIAKRAEQTAKIYHSIQEKVYSGSLSVIHAPDPSNGLSGKSISRRRYDALRQNYVSSQREVASYQGREVPSEVLKRAELASKRFQAAQTRIDRGSLHVVHKGEVVTSGPVRAAESAVRASSSVLRSGNGQFSAARDRATIISQARFENLQKQMSAAKAELAAYQGSGGAPASVVRRAEKVSALYQSIQRKIDNGTLRVASAAVSDAGSKRVSGSGTGRSTAQSGGAQNGSFAKGDTAFYERNVHRYSSRGRRRGDRFLKRNGTPFQRSSINNYDKLKIYHTSKFGYVVGSAGKEVVSAIGGKIVALAQSEQSGTANMMVTSKQKAGDALAAARMVKDAPKQLAAACAAASDVVHSARNVGRFLRGKKALDPLQHKVRTLRQLDKEMAIPFSGAERVRMNKKFGANVLLSNAKLQRKIFIQTTLNRNLSAEIKLLVDKGKTLTPGERKHLMNLLQQKKVANEKLRKLHGLRQAREKASARNWKIYGVSERDAKKTIKRAAKKKQKLTKDEKSLLARLKERQEYAEKRKRLAKGVDSRKRLLASVGGFFKKAAQESEEAGVQGLLSASRLSQNRLVRVVLRHFKKVAMLPLRPVKKVVVHAATPVVEKAVETVVHSRVYRELNGGLYNRAARRIRSAVPDRIRTRFTAGANRVRNVRDSVLSKYNALKKRLANSRLGRTMKSIGNGFQAFGKAFQFVKKSIVRIGLVCAALVVAIVLIGSFLTSVGGVVDSFIFWDDSDDDGRIDLAPFISVLNDEQADINNIVAGHKRNTEANGGKYKRVYVNYLGGGVGNNYREILSMTAVYFQQDLENTDAVNRYISELFRASNRVSTSESDLYYCSGCEERSYLCYDAPDDYATDERRALYARSDHSGESRIIGSSKGCVRSPYFSCRGCSWHSRGQWMDDPGACTNYTKTIIDPVDPASGYRYKCNGHCHGRHYSYSCPGHTEKICKGHIDLYVNVTCFTFDEIFYLEAASGVSGSTTTLVGNEITEQVWNFLKSKGIDDIHAAAIMGNIEGESNFNPDLIEVGSGAGYGLCQWTGGRRTQLNAYAASVGKPASDLGVQLDFFWMEYAPGASNSYASYQWISETYSYAGFLDCETIEDATTHFCRGWERAGIERLNVRIEAAKKYYNLYEGTSPEMDPGSEETVRAVIDYETLANEAAAGPLSVREALECFGFAKDPEITWRTGRFDSDNSASFAARLKEYDSTHINSAFTNVEQNVFSYVALPLDTLKGLAVEKTGWCDADTAFEIIKSILIPYDREHPDELYGSDVSSEFYFDGWNEDNRNWSKDIYENMTSEHYSGLDQISGGSGIYHGSVSLEDLVIQGSKMDVVYYCQKDSRWASKVIIPGKPTVSASGKPTNMIGPSGCGFTSMAIIVSSMTDTIIDPAGIVDLYGRSYYLWGGGAYHSLIAGVSRDYGLSCTELHYSNLQGVIDALEDGKLVVALVGRGGSGWTGNGYYRGDGHFLVICGVTEDGSFLLADPSRPDVSSSGQPIGVEHFVASGMKKFWVIGK